MTTAELDKQALIKSNQIVQAVMDGKLTNAAAAELLRKLRKELHEARFNLKGEE